MPKSNVLLKADAGVTPVEAHVDADVVAFRADTTAVRASAPGQFTTTDERTDFFIERDGERFAGTHLIIDLVGASRLDELEHMEEAMRRCVEVSKATLLHIHLHHFTPNGGVSGVAVLSESHISVHTWPEANYAAKLNRITPSKCCAKPSTPPTSASMNTVADGAWYEHALDRRDASR